MSKPPAPVAMPPTWGKALGLPTTKREGISSRTEEIKQLWPHHSAAEIAEAFDMSLDAVRKQVQRLKLPAKPHGWRPSGPPKIVISELHRNIGHKISLFCQRMHYRDNEAASIFGWDAISLERAKQGCKPLNLQEIVTLTKVMHTTFEALISP